MIYLDNAATTFPKAEAVYTEMDRVNRTLAVNAGRGSYRAAVEANHIIEETKSRVLDLFHAQDLADVVLTPSVTYAMNQVLNGWHWSDSSVIYVSPYEHNAVARTVHAIAQKYGCAVFKLPLKKNSYEIDVERCRFLFTVNVPDAVILTAVSNVTGYVLPAAEIFAAAKEKGAFTVLDAAQAAGLIDLDMKTLSADVIAFAGHKTMGGPFGVGGFVLKHGVDLEPVLTGGTGSDSLNLLMPGTGAAKYTAASQNIVAIAGLNAALKELDVEEHRKHLEEMTGYLVEQLGSVSSVEIKGYIEGKCLGIVSFVVEGYESAEIGNILDSEYDIAVRTGYHCAPYVHEHLDDISNAGTVRVGLGMFNTKEDVDALAEALETL